MGLHSNEDLIRCVKIEDYVGFWVPFNTIVAISGGNILHLVKKSQRGFQSAFETAFCGTHAKNRF